MVDKKIGRFRIRNLEIFTFISLFIIYTLAILVRPGDPIYEWIANLSSGWTDIAVNSGSALSMAFIFSSFGNTSVLIVFPYALIVYLIAQNYSNFWLLGLVSGLGAGFGELSSYLVGFLAGSSKKVSESELGEKFHRIKLQFEKHPSSIPLTIFLFAATPLPDDAILVPLGIMKYPPWKSILPCMAGKTVLTTVLAFLGSMIGQNSQYLNELIEQNSALFFLRLFVPSDSVNPAADLVQFSLIFIIIYIVARLDIERISMRISKERKEFELILLKGANTTISELILRFNITNKDSFLKFFESFTQAHDNVKISGDKVHFDALNYPKEAFNQSFEFAKFMNH